MKKLRNFLILSFLTISCTSVKDVTNNSVFSLDAIQADNSYYTKAVLEYHLIQKVLKKYNTSSNDNSIILLAKNEENKDENIYDCTINVPIDLKSLKSGFQYRYYLFDSNNSAALQAFGITDIKNENKTQYLVIDYIQYKDFKCLNLPTIRYAVGLRSELKFTKIDSDIDLKGKGGLAKLAAQVELGTAEVNFSLKTIGLTGKPARLNIPQGVSFDVTTYKDFQNSIEFLKNNLEIEEQVTKNLTVAPEIIPVMDEYRPSIKSSLNAFAKEIISLSIAKDRLKKLPSRKLSDESKKRIDSIYEQEIDRIYLEKLYLDTIQSLVYSSKPYIKVLKSAKTTRKSEKITELENLRKNEEIKGSNLFDFFPGFPNLNKFNAKKLRKLEEIYYNSDSITLYEFNKFLNIIDREMSTEEELDKVIEILDKNPTLEGLKIAGNFVEN